MNKYPIITIPGAIISKKTTPSLHCLPTGQRRNPESKRHCKGTMRPMISDDIDIATKQTILLYMRRSWGLPTITGPVNAKFTFSVPTYPILPTLAGRDLSNSYQLLEDLMQADQWKIHKRGQNRGLKYLASAGAGIITNDSLIQGYEGSRFVYLCYICKWGITGKRRSVIKDRKKVGGCLGSTKCPQRQTTIEITDMEMTAFGYYEVKNDI